MNLSRISSLMISIGGGEPFLRADLPSVIAALARRHMPLLTTNGWCVTAENARAVFQAGLWGASVSSTTRTRRSTIAPAASTAPTAARSGRSSTSPRGAPADSSA